MPPDDRPPSMRILLVSDLHYALRQFDWTAAVAAKFDVVVIAGDLLDIASTVDGGVQITVILKYLKRLTGCTRLIVSSGNHDLDVRDDSGEKIARWMNQVRQLGVPTDGDSIVLGSTLITICPWWDGPNTKRAVQAQMERDSSKPRTSWVWVYHAPPSGSPTCWDGRRSYGDTELALWIEKYKPDLVFAGHIHQAPFETGGSWADRIGPTWVFNCGKQTGPTPCHIVVDTVAREVAWFSLAGAETAQLDQPLRRPLQSLDESAAWLTLTARNPDPSRV
jgi:Icc-related predicted phosphoesterase